MGAGRRRPLLPLLLPLLLLLPAARGDCGPLPKLLHAEPPEENKRQASFEVGSRVTYRCLQGFAKLPRMSDTVECLGTSRWSDLLEFCGRSCPSPLRLSFAKISEEDETKNFYAVGSTVNYTCRPGYEKTTEKLLTSTCLENLTWSEVPELCQKKSCGVPANVEHGKVAETDHLFGARANVICDDGYILAAQPPYIRCLLKGNDVAWSKLPICRAITCAPPPAVPNGQHNGSSVEEFTYNSAVTYTCDPGLQLIGNETLRCTFENKIYGVWSGPPPECRAFFSIVDTTAVTNPTKLLEDERAENHHVLAFILIPSCIGVCILLVWVIMRWKKKKTKCSYDTGSPKHEIKRMDLQMGRTVTDNGEKPVPWHAFFCHLSSCHVCPSCEARLHAHLGQPAGRLCATCEDWLRARHGPAVTYSALSISGDQSRNPAERSSTDKAPDVLRTHLAEEAALERHEAEQPGTHERPAHVCPICEDWLRAHLGQREGVPTTAAVPAGAPSWEEAGADGAVCPACEDRLHLSLVHAAGPGHLTCPLRGAGPGAHLVPAGAPACHACPRCRAPTHAHLCQRPDGRPDAPAAPPDAEPRENA